MALGEQWTPMRKSELLAFLADRPEPGRAIIRRWLHSGVLNPLENHQSVAFSSPDCSIVGVESCTFADANQTTGGEPYAQHLHARHRPALPGRDRIAGGAVRFQPIWVDLESPRWRKSAGIKQHYGLSIPEDAMDEDIEESARFYEEDNGELHIRSDFLIDDDEDPRSVRVAFILNQHNASLKSGACCFPSTTRTCRCSACCACAPPCAPGLIEDAKEVLLKLFDADAGILRPTRWKASTTSWRRQQAGAGGRRDRRAGAGEVLAAIAARKT